MFRILLIFGTAFTASNGWCRERLLSDLNAGSQFELVDQVSIPIPLPIQMLGMLPDVRVGEHGVRIASERPAAADAGCIVSGLSLGDPMPNHVTLPKGAKFEVDSIRVEKKDVTLKARCSSLALHATFKCAPEKASKTAMAVEVFEKIFRRKVRLLVSDSKPLDQK